MENEMERKFGYKICQNGIEYFKNGMEDNLPYFHTRFCAWYLQKNIYILAEVFGIYYCLWTNHGTLVECIAQTVHIAS